MDKNCKEKYFYYLEYHGPKVIALFVMCIIIYVSNKYELGNNFDKILDATMVFSSIIVGFMGALLGILYSVKNTTLIKKLFEYRNQKELLKAYFRDCIICGMVLVVITILLYIRYYFCSLVLYVTVGTWGFLLPYLFCSTYRIIKIMLKIIFDEQNSDSIKREKTELNEMERQNLENKYSDN